ncbi:MFS transporter [Aeromicrobium wangtongii]|uniref:MFS transporter n=1 Tax=Aeromicrobium wangtongii TaxID=2969247 RepID=A0ABY5M9Y5_9ACTN|nr:MFS transporter [Aeromicrobium wangtongii]MCD9199573.1 MFS transporter [Aeromicrobium wangtongii]UUP13926.1 MFS transporter [Aeromicrobium wangtongii]
MASAAPRNPLADDSAAPPAGRPGLTLAAVCFGLFMVGLDSTVVHIANPAIQTDLGATFGELQWVINSYLLALAVFLIPGGKIGDRFGRKRLYLIGVAIFAVASVAIGLVGSIEGVLVFRALQGLSAAMLMPQTISLLRATFSREKFGMAVGIWGGISSVSIAGGPLVSGVLVEHLGWEWVFYINVPIAIIGLVFGAWAITETPKVTEGRIDLAGIILLGLVLFGVVFAVVQAQVWGWGSGRTIGLFVAALVLFAIFLRVESRVQFPLLPLALFRSAGVSVGGLVFVANFFAILGVTFLITLFLMNTLGHSTTRAGLMMLPMSAFSIPSAPIGALLTAKIGPRKVAAGGLTLMAIGLALLTQVDASTSYWWMAIPFVIIAFGSGFAIPSGADLIVGGAPVHLAGVASGFQTTCIQIGGAIGTAVLSAIVATKVAPAALAAGLPDSAAEAGAAGVVFDGIPSINDGFISGVHIGLVVAAGLCIVIAALVMIAVREPKHHDVETIVEETLSVG